MVTTPTTGPTLAPRHRRVAGRPCRLVGIHVLREPDGWHPTRPVQTIHRRRPPRKRSLPQTAANNGHRSVGCRPESPPAASPGRIRPAGPAWQSATRRSSRPLCTSTASRTQARPLRETTVPVHGSPLRSIQDADLHLCPPRSRKVHQSPPDTHHHARISPPLPYLLRPHEAHARVSRYQGPYGRTPAGGASERRLRARPRSPRPRHRRPPGPNWPSEAPPVLRRSVRSS